MIVREERLQVRIDASTKRVLAEAANAMHVSLSAFVTLAAHSRAEDILAERQRIALSQTAAAAFEEALNRPGEVNERLAEALARPVDFSWLD